MLDLTFPSDYTEELSGKDVEFTVTVNAVKVPLEEPTDEWVAANIEGYSTVEEYRAGIRSQQEENNQQTADDQVQYTAWMQVVDSSTINEYPRRWWIWARISTVSSRAVRAVLRTGAGGVYRVFRRDHGRI